MTKLAEAEQKAYLAKQRASKEFLVRIEGGGRWHILHPIVEVSNEDVPSLAWAADNGSIWCYGLDHDIRELPE